MAIETNSLPSLLEILSSKNQPDRELALFYAIEKKNADIVLAILQEYPDLAIAYDACEVGQYKAGWYALEWAFSQKMWSCVEKFLDILQENPSLKFKARTVHHDQYTHTFDENRTLPLSPLTSTLIAATRNQQTEIALKLLQLPLQLRPRFKHPFYLNGRASPPLLDTALKNGDEKLASHLMFQGASLTRNMLAEYPVSVQIAWKLSQQMRMHLDADHPARNVVTELDLNLAIITREKAILQDILRLKPFFVKLAIFQAIAEKNDEMALYILKHFPKAAVALDWGIESAHYTRVLVAPGRFALEWAVVLQNWPLISAFLDTLKQNPHLKWIKKPGIMQEYIHTSDKARQQPLGPLDYGFCSALKYKKFTIVYKFLEAGANPNVAYHFEGDPIGPILDLMLQPKKASPPKLIAKLLYHGANPPGKNPGYDTTTPEYLNLLNDGWKLRDEQVRKKYFNLALFTVIHGWKQPNCTLQKLDIEAIWNIFKMLRPDLLEEAVNTNFIQSIETRLQQAKRLEKNPAPIPKKVNENKQHLGRAIKRICSDYVKNERSLLSSQTELNDSIQKQQKIWFKFIQKNEILMLFLDIEQQRLIYQATKNNLFAWTTKSGFCMFLGQVKDEIAKTYREIHALAQVFYPLMKDHADFSQRQAAGIQPLIKGLRICKTPEEIEHLFAFFIKGLSLSKDYKQITGDAAPFFSALTESLHMYQKNLLDSFRHNHDAVEEFLPIMDCPK